MINPARDPILASLGERGSGFFIIRLAMLFWSGDQLVNDRFLAQAYDSQTGAEAGMRILADRLEISPDSLRIEELNIAIADQIGFIEPNNLVGLPLWDWADYWSRKAEVAKAIAMTSGTHEGESH